MSFKVKDKTRLHRCYELAFDFVQTHPKWLLVHGATLISIGMKGPVGGHAWAESGDYVWEPYTADFFLKEDWYRVSIHNNPPEIYTAAEALKLYRRFKRKDFPWEMRLWLKAHPVKEVKENV